MDSRRSRSWLLPVTLVVITSALIAIGIAYQRQNPSEPNAIASAIPDASPSVSVSAAPSPDPSASPSPVPAGSPAPGAPDSMPDLSVDSQGLSKATVILQTSQGVIKFKFYPREAPNTVNRIIELIKKGFYNGLIFHRVIPGFVVQGGDPLGNGTGGSGQKLKAEFNKHRHLEGTVAMARAADPDSADSQFYISLGAHPHLDQNYTVFGQVTEGLDVARKLKVGDKMNSVTIE